MQDDSESVPEDVLRALVADGRMVAPAESRARVLTRLGVAAAAGAAALAHGSIASAAAGKAAGHSAAPAASVLGFGLAKVLVLHPVIGIVATLAVGSGVGVVAYHAVEPTHTPPSVVATPNAAKAKKPARAVTPALTARPATDTPNTPAPEAPSAAVSEKPAEQRAAARGGNASAPNAKGPAPAALVPAPDLPQNTASARLAEQQALLDQGRASLRRGDGPGALAIIAGHESLYPVTEFAEERAAIRILALVMSGQGDEARAQAERFRQRFPTSLFLPAIEKSLAPVAPPAAAAAYD